MAVLSPTQPSPRLPRPTERAPRRVGFSQRLSRWDVKLSPYLYISPFFILFAITGLFPLAYTAVVSVFDWNLLGGQGDFVGLQNYTDVLAQPTFWKSLRNTFSIFLLSSVPRSCARSSSRRSSTRTCVPRPSGAWASCSPTSSHRSPSR